MAEMIHYAGIGSRKTPWPVCYQMHLLGQQLAEYGLTLRSGHALRADQSFEAGCDSMQGKKEIFTADHTRVEWVKHAAGYHPTWDSCSDFAKLLHGRNSAIMLGAKLDSAVKFVVCWTQDGLPIGGTGQALRIAEAMEIPVFNLYKLPSNSVLEFLRNRGYAK
jgi:hypothetical protein